MLLCSQGRAAGIWFYAVGEIAADPAEFLYDRGCFTRYGADNWIPDEYLPNAEETAMKETELYLPIKAFLEAQGYQVKGEVRSCDVVARRGEEEPVIVEMKTSFSLPLILQGVQRLSMSDAVYLAFPDNSPGAAWKQKRREAMALCRRLGLGILLVRMERDPPKVLVPLDPAPYQPRKHAKRRALLLKEFEHRRGDPTAGGAARQPVMTAYRQDALACAGFIAGRDDGEQPGQAQPREIREALGVDRAGAILQKDVYGWFVRLERGVYGLSEKGREAVAQGEDAPTRPGVMWRAQPPAAPD